MSSLIKGKNMLLDYSLLDSTKRYKIMSQAVVPRPIAWIITEDEGVVNAAPFSYFTPLSSDPATVIVSIGHKEDKETPKDTLINILETDKATICFVDIRNLEYMKLSAKPLEKKESEIKKFNMQTEYIKDKYPPIIKGTKSAMFCDFYKKVDMDGLTIPIILEVKSQYFDDEIIDENLNFELHNVCRVGKNFASFISLDN